MCSEVRAGDEGSQYTEFLSLEHFKSRKDTPHSEMSLGPSGVVTERWAQALSLGTLEGH